VPSLTEKGASGSVVQKLADEPQGKESSFSVTMRGSALVRNVHRGEKQWGKQNHKQKNNGRKKD